MVGLHGTVQKDAVSTVNPKSTLWTIALLSDNIITIMVQTENILGHFDSFC